MTINERIKQVRKTFKLSQAEFARAVFISNGYIAEMETGNRKVNDRIIHLVALTFGISEQWLKTGKGDMRYKTPDEKLRRMINLFNELPPKFQDYVVAQIEALLAATRNGNP
ncbi:MAG: helix-turn-helix domain-containing protein [Treponema sp.]|jgi:transcriptional regulator with XRE-family HTH domain|nr:helix-turn-helix domain-containing protein [Treponema sp.]